MTGVRPNLDLGVVGNCQVSALVDDQGRIVWMCLPRPDGDPVFSALLTPEGGAATDGVFAVDLADLVAAEQSYRRNTAVVETILRDSNGGAIRIRDFCPRYRSRGRMFRPMMLVRVVEPLAGRPVVRIRLRPTRAFGAAPARSRAGSHHIVYDLDGLDIRVTTDASLSAIADQGRIVLDSPLTFVIGPNQTIEETPAVLAHSFLLETTQYWQDWVRTLAVPFDWQQEVIRAAITLKLCTFEDTGAVLAALTTSIPEGPGSGRNWDYRYCWLRDSYFVIQALNRLGATRTMEAYLHFIDHIVADSSVDELQPVYSLTGGRHLEERIVASQAGYRGTGPIRVGNQAALQTQNDVYGSVILAISQLFFDERLARGGDRGLFEQLERLGDRASVVFDRPDAGLWEFRGRTSVHTFSAVMSWAGCDRLARIAERLGLQDRESHWREVARRMREEILERSWNEQRGAFAASFDGDHLDASLLLLPELGLLPATDPRFVATLDVIGKELRDGDLLFRYRHTDDFGTPSTAFAICAFWYVNALAAAGRVDEAREHFTRLLKLRNRVGLLSEDIDPVDGELWGNFPQTYSLVGVINSALRLSRSWEASL
ncbi:MAG: glycoside hydrolase family 15 protein [Steroidobacteraceae bacterium]